MEPCDCCGKKVDERSMVVVKDKYYICQACDGYYTEEEVIEKIELNNEE